ncbi:MAG: hypothetical protein QGH42_03675 [Kiritimatiellia bacterium]|jgi:hypothetical protein|nr:hypothetical protein [Kiritimatiellia bacterium]
MALGDFVSRVKGVYDRLIFGAVLVGLIGSLAYLGWHVGTVQTTQQAFIAEIDSITPTHPEAQPVDVTPLEAGLAAVRGPSQMALGEAIPAMWVPGTRVQCVDCRRPIPFKTDSCPFCRAEQPVEIWDREDRDLDRDGILDVWEDKYGLNPKDPTDAGRDLDGDGFSNIEEFLASPQTNPADPDDSPSIVIKLCIQSLVADPFHLRFKSVIKLPGKDNRQFAINTRGNSKTYFKKIGEDVEGFLLHAFEPKTEQVRKHGRLMDVDVSILTLKRGNKLIGLTKGKGVQYNEYTCTLLFKADMSTYTLRLHDEFNLQGKRYKLIDIDNATKRVVIKRVLDGVDLQVRKCAESDHAGQKPNLSSSSIEQGVNP